MNYFLIISHSTANVKQMHMVYPPKIAEYAVKDWDFRSFFMENPFSAQNRLTVRKKYAMIYRIREMP